MLPCLTLVCILHDGALVELLGVNLDNRFSAWCVALQRPATVPAGYTSFDLGIRIQYQFEADQSAEQRMPPRIEK
ncbi:hypothetical protein [Rhodocyclus purpureus]|uniref:hypothetical protein n=1 Tax=Rhodocyclus purpureus TaxID=1067 RepID=UPI001914BCC2|nr:hypothetical protein [Rhodocyclus purpureus]